MLMGNLNFKSGLVAFQVCTVLTLSACLQIKTLKPVINDDKSTSAPSAGIGCDPSTVASANGSVGYPFQIWNNSDLDTLNVHNGIGMNVVLCADLDFANGAIIPYPIFKGVFNGNHHSISNATINEYGLFQKFDGAIAKDLSLNHFTVHAATQHTGILVGMVKDSSVTGMTISNSVVTSSSGFYVGGLIGLMMNSVTTGSLIKQNKVISTQVTLGSFAPAGGLIGALAAENLFNDVITQNRVAVSISNTASTYCVGGLLGYVANADITQNEVNITFLTGGFERLGAMIGCFETAGGALPTSIKNNSITFSGLVGDGFARVGGVYGTSETSNNATVDSNWINGTVTAANASLTGVVFGHQNQGTVSILNTYWHNDGSGLPAYQSCAGTCSIDGNSSSVNAYTTTPFTGGFWSDASIWTFTNGAPPTLVGLP